MAKQIKQFKGTRPPILEQGELATNGRFLYLGTGNGKYNVFEESFDTDKSQVYHGFTYDAARGGFILPRGFKMSDLEILIDVLPKTLLNYNKRLMFYIENGTHVVNDLGRGFSFSTLAYQLFFAPLEGGALVRSLDQPVVMDMTGGAMGISGNVRFDGVRFVSTSNHVALAAGLGARYLGLRKCSFDTVYTPVDLGSEAHKSFTDCYFKSPNVSLFKSVSGFTSLSRNISDPLNPPARLADMLGGHIQVGNDYANLNCQGDSSFYSPCGGTISIGNQTLM